MSPLRREMGMIRLNLRTAVFIENSMLFNSFTFAIFFLILYTAYLLLRRHRRWQNGLLLLGSYIFYGFWDWRFLSLLWISTIIDFLVGRKIEALATGDKNRKRLVWLSVTTNLGILAIFKYTGFFTESFTSLLANLGIVAEPVLINLILPVGISFYTFQTLSYTISIYRGELKATRDIGEFALFVAFFPQLVAGPIERASNLLPQIARERVITPAKVDSAIWLMVWGFFKKLVIADNLALVVNPLFANSDAVGFDIILATFAFSIQIYCDFSGYTDIARGVARMMGFELMLNFKLPYFAMNPSDFWRRWHVSLSEWLRDYLYIPLGGNRGGRGKLYRNLMVTMLLGGLWHGAAWNFVIWGAYHGAILVAYQAGSAYLKDKQWLPTRVTQALWPLQMGAMFILTLLGWLIFRATSWEQISAFVRNVSFELGPDSLTIAGTIAAFTLPLLLVQIAQHRSNDLMVALRLPPAIRGLLYALMVGAMAILGQPSGLEFIYFQF